VFLEGKKEGDYPCGLPNWEGRTSFKVVSNAANKERSAIIFKQTKMEVVGSESII
jgi:hypothetical protein